MESSVEIKESKYHQINFEERRLIERLLKTNTPKKQIARLLGRSITTIRKEIKRGSVEQKKEIKSNSKKIDIPLYETKLVYFADVAQREYKKSRQNCGNKCKLFQCKDFINFVEQQMRKQHWSVDASVGYAKRHSLFQEENTVTTQTVYNWIDRCFLKTRNIDLPKKLRRNTHKEKIRKQKRFYGTSIEERPTYINERLEFGHWEGDGIVGADHKGHLITLVERKTGLGILMNVGDREASRIVDVIDTLQEECGGDFSTIFKSITFDNGSEFSDCEAMEKQGRTKIYYAHPYSSWERGTNENWNGIVRRFIPKGSSFDKLSDVDMQRIMRFINDLPRKRFGYRTPREVFIEELQHLFEEAVA